MHAFRLGIASSLRDGGHAQPRGRSSYAAPSFIDAATSSGTGACWRSGQPVQRRERQGGDVLCRGGNSEASSSFEAGNQGESREDEDRRERSEDSSESSGHGRPTTEPAAAEDGSHASSTETPPLRQEAPPSSPKQAGPGPPGPVLSTSPEELWASLQPSVAYLAAEEQEVVKDALGLAFWAHDGQKRKSGEPFIIHPVEVTRILAELEMDWESLVAGLLHDTVEDTDRITFGEIEAKYGPAVRRIVEGETKVSKLGKVPSHEGAVKGELQGRGAGDGQEQEQGPGQGQEESRKKKADVKADDLRQMFLAMTEEVRVIIVKLADRLHNMRTLAHMPPHKQEHIARETLRVFAPLARLLGIYRIKAELEDLSFHYAYPKDYERVRRRLERLQRDQEGGMGEAQEKLEAALRQDQFLGLMTHGCRVVRCWKEPYSLFRKLLARECKLEELTGVGQLNVVLSLRPEQAGREPFVAQQVCYHVLGLVHSMWPPVPGSVKDYIATPKPNGYQSLHTTVLPVGSGALFPLEVQIRTQEMDSLAEWGITTQLAAAAAAAAAAASAAAAKLASSADEGGDASLGLAAAGAAGVVSPTLGIPIKSVEIGSAARASAGAPGVPQNGALAAGSPEEPLEAGQKDVAPGAVGEETTGAGASALPAALVRQQRYAAGGGSKGGFAHKVSWLNAIREWQEEFVGNVSATEFVETVTGDLLGSRIFVFTPRGEVKNLPEGATVVDYAYSIHSDVGNQMYAAKVNGNFVPPTQALANADVVEVLTYPAHAASLKGYTTRQEWLGHVRTRSARHKLTKYLREKAREVTAQRVNAFAAYSGEESSSDEGEASRGSASTLLDPSAPEGTNGAVAGDSTRSQAAQRRTNGALRSQRQAQASAALETWSVGTDKDRLQEQVENGAAQRRDEECGAAEQTQERGPNGAAVAPEGPEANPGNGAWASRGPGPVPGPQAVAPNGVWRSWKARRFQPFMPAAVAARVLWEPRGAPETSPLGQQRVEIRGGNGAAVLQSALEEFTQWQELTVGMWQRLSITAEPVQWLAIHCYDRSGMLPLLSLWGLFAALLEDWQARCCIRGLYLLQAFGVAL